MGTPLTYRSLAKINLYLDILDRRKDGFHNIETIYQTVELADTLHFQEAGSRVTLVCESNDIETGEDNLIHRAATLLRQRCGHEQGVDIELEKRIPISAGLAGGSGNAAAALVALNSLWGLGLKDERIREMALELGSDVPYCTVGGTQAGTGCGERLTPLKPLTDTWFVLLHPSMLVSTNRIYNHPDLGCNPEKPINGRTQTFQKAIDALEAREWGNVVFNRFQELVFAEQPQLAQFQQRLIDEGCAAAAMSGSGPTVFGVCKDKRQAQNIAQRFDDVESSVVCTVGVGVERID